MKKEARTVMLREPRMKEASNIILKLMCEEQRCTTRGSGTSNIVWFITILLRALLLDEL
jgi:hypothetical protein